MQLGGARTLSDPPDLAVALRQAAELLGHRPAITVLRPDSREEQGVASLAQWAAKGAHLLDVDLGLSIGDRLFVSGPAGWMPAAVCLAAWWAGVTVVTEPSQADAAIVHEEVGNPPTEETLWFGDELDGSPRRPEAQPAYPVEVQAFPDAPPPPRAADDQIALRTADGGWTQRELIERARTWGPDGTLGLEHHGEPSTWIPAVAVRPLLVGRPTVVLAGVGRERAEGEAVRHWV